jgi:hypothetical protein
LTASIKKAGRLRRDLAVAWAWETEIERWAGMRRSDLRVVLQQGENSLT